jgi:hypothetical protein
MIANQILSDVIHFMKYAKYLPEKKRRELYPESVERNKQMHIAKFPSLAERITEVYDKFVLPKKSLPSMRSMQFAGEAIAVNEVRGFNCSFLPIDHPKAFSEVMFLLLSGAGVGYSVQKHHIASLPLVKKTEGQTEFIIPDNIEGWADAVDALVNSYFTAGPEIVFNFSQIRKKGMRLITSGGKAPGAKPLRECLTKIKRVLDNCLGTDGNRVERLASTEVHSIVCLIADAVLAGGIRRSSCISLFSFDDHAMRTCKHGEWWVDHPEYARSNNSAMAPYDEITKEMFHDFWKDVVESKAGEPGIYWTNNKEMGTNPCKPLRSHILTPEGVITFGQALESRDDFITVVLPSGKHARASLPFKTGEKQQVWEITTANNSKIYGTDNHRHEVKRKDGKIEWVENKDLVIGDEFNCVWFDKQFNPKHFVQKVTKINPKFSVEDVYDITVEDDSHSFIDTGVVSHNCGEAALRAYSFCNLCELNVNLVENQQDFNDLCAAAAFLNTLQASYTNFTYLRPIWRQTTEEDALIGIGLTGIASGKLDNIDLRQGARIVKQVNKETAELIGINSSARCGLIKPSGTTSLILSTSSGIHNWYARFYIRRARVNKKEPIYAYLLEHLPFLLEDEVFDPENTAVISFPQKAPEGAVVSADSSAIDILERCKRFNEEWIRESHNRGDNYHNVSATVYVNEDEYDSTRDWMWENRSSYHGLTILPFENHSYQQAPFEECTEEVYNELLAKFKHIDLSLVEELEDLTNLNDQAACVGGVCSII